MDKIIGVISDTHGLLRPEAVRALHGSELIVHAGDIGTFEVLDALERIAPVLACRGNVDVGEWARAVPETRDIEVAGKRIHLLHDISELALDLEAGGYDAVIFGHSHKPLVEQAGSILYLNPGSAGPRRFTLPVCVATLRVRDGALAAEHIELDVPPPRSRRG